MQNKNLTLILRTNFNTTSIVLTVIPALQRQNQEHTWAHGQPGLFGKFQVKVRDAVSQKGVWERNAA